MTSTEPLLRGAADLAAAKGLLIHTHASENRSEVEIIRSRTGIGNVDYLDRMELLTPRTCLAHAVQTDAPDWSVLAERGVSVVHCPSSNMRLASGVCPVTELRRSGVRVVLGSDGAACNDRLDPFAEMRLATALPRARVPAESLSSFDALRMATVEGAAALRLGGEPGLQAGSLCDLAILDPEAGWALPDGWNDEPYGAIVHAMGRENVFATIVDGVVRYRAGDSTVGGLKPTAAEVREAMTKLKTRR